MIISTGSSRNLHGFLVFGRVFFAFGVFIIPASGQQPDNAPIQDNSFLVEEAYNQNYGVVQHLQGFQRLWQSKDWAYTFTQEWPVDLAPKNQLSYTIPFVHSGGSADSASIGDVTLNYRYQLVGSGETRIALAPRISLLLPSGNSRRGHGAGGAGFQTNIPLSAVLTKRMVSHWNAGTTIIPAARDTAGNRAATYGYNFGSSFVWLAHPRVNLLLETVFNSSESVTAPGKTQRSNDVFLNPGIRWAYNFNSGLQIVAGVGMPIGFAESSGERGIFLYLSFEHPYRKAKSK